MASSLIRLLLPFLLALLLLVPLCSGSHYYGASATFSYRGKNPDGSLRVTFRKRATFDGCFQQGWSCSSGDCGSATQTQRGTIDSSTNAPQYNRQWCETEEISTWKIWGDKPFQRRAASCCWIPTRNGVSSWNWNTLVDLGRRSDTKKPNRSPDIAILPFLRVPQNCPRTYNLMSFDRDKDKVRCRFGNIIHRNMECSTCSRPAGFHLDQDSCTLHYRRASADPRVFGFEMVVEDFPQNHITLSYRDGSKVHRFPPTPRSKRQVNTYTYTLTPPPGVWSTGTTQPPQTKPSPTASKTPITSWWRWTTTANTPTTAHTQTITQPGTTTQSPTTSPQPWWQTRWWWSTTTQSPTTTQSLPTTQSPQTSWWWRTATTQSPTTTQSLPTTQSPQTSWWWRTATTQSPTTTQSLPTTQSPQTSWWWWRTTTQSPTTTQSLPTTQSPQTSWWWWRTATTQSPTTTQPLPPTQSPQTSWWWWRTATTQSPTTTQSLPTTQSPQTSWWWWRTATTQSPTTTQSLPTTQSPQTSWWRWRTTAQSQTSSQPTTTSWWWSTTPRSPRTKKTPHTSTQSPTTSLLPWWQTSWWWSTTTQSPRITQSQAVTQPRTSTTTQSPRTSWWWWSTTTQSQGITRPHTSTTTPSPTTWWWSTTNQPSTTTHSQATPWWWWATSSSPNTQPSSTPWWWWWNNTQQGTTTPQTPTTTQTLSPSTAWWWWQTSPIKPMSAPTATTRPQNSDLPPLSQLPLQFSLLVDPPVPSCQDGLYLPQFVPPTPENGARIQAQVDKLVEIRIQARAAYTMIKNIIISGPMHITTRKTTHNEFIIGFKPTKDELGDAYAVCFAVESVAWSSPTSLNATHYSSNNHHVTPSARPVVYQSEMRCVLLEVMMEQIKSSVICTESSMRVEVEKSSLPGLHEDHLRLSDPSNALCSLHTHSNSTHVIGIVPLNACGTQIEEDENSLIFRNEITAFDDSADVITRNHRLEVQFFCQFPKEGNVSLSFSAHRKKITVWDTGLGEFTYQFEFYRDQTFHTMMEPSSYPLEYEMGSRIYMQIEASSSSSLSSTEMLVESCRAAPYDNPNYSPSYSIIQDGCTVDQTVEIYSSGQQRRFQFSMEAFKFIGLHDQVYISCSVLVCEAGNPSSRCSEGCSNRTTRSEEHRRRREAVIQSSKHFISQGPLRLKRTPGGSGSSVNLNLNLLFISGCLLSALCMVCWVLIYKIKKSANRYQPLPAHEA